MKRKRYRGFLFLDFALLFLILIAIFLAYCRFIADTSFSIQEHYRNAVLQRRVSDAADYLVRAALVKEGEDYRLTHELSPEKLLHIDGLEKTLAQRLHLKQLRIFIGSSPPLPSSSPPSTAHICVFRLALLGNNITKIIVCGELNDVP